MATDARAFIGRGWNLTAGSALAELIDDGPLWGPDAAGSTWRAIKLREWCSRSHVDPCTKAAQVNFIAYELATTFSELHRKAMDKDRVVDAKEQLNFGKARRRSSQEYLNTGKETK